MARDTISVVESAYDIRCGPADWLRGVAEGIDALVRPEFGTLANHVDELPCGYRISCVVGIGEQIGPVVSRMEALARLHDKHLAGRATWVERRRAAMYGRMHRAGLRESPEHLLYSEFRKFGPVAAYRLGSPAKDVFALFCRHIDGHGATILTAGLGQPGRLTQRDRRKFQMLSAHIKAGYRLRQRGAYSRSLALPTDGAVVDLQSGAVDADGEAIAGGASHVIREEAMRVDSARTRQLGRGAEALEIWRGLIRGQWSLVEQFDTDGRRFLVAHRNPENISDPRGLTDIEARVARLVAAGYSDKLVGYHLGLAEGTVAVHLSVVLRKLLLRGRWELVRLLGVLA